MKRKKSFFEQITIIGVGLIGGSLAKAVLERGLAGRVVGVCRSRKSATHVKQARLGIETRVGLNPETLGHSDCVILAAQVSEIKKTFRSIAPHLRPGTVVMDIGSTKVEIEKSSRVLPKGVDFVGCHPLAGSEKKGARFADSRIFEGAFCFIMRHAEKKARVKAESFWKALGMRVVLESPEAHDRIAAKVSHLPHVTSTALLLSMMRNDPRNDLRYGGTGLESMIRIAGSNPVMWLDIFNSNRRYISRELKRLILELKRFDRALLRKDKRDLLSLLNFSNLLKQSHALKRGKKSA